MHNHSCRKFWFLIPFAILGFAALFTWVVYALWNGVLVEVVAVKAITYWQALGLLLLAKILFGGFPCRGGGGHCGGSHWRGRMMAKKWESLSPEDREKMREEMRHRFGDWPRPPWCDSEKSKSDDSGKSSGA
jgi:Ca2+/H+ antiporter, TMEM165/GDT1 family